MQVQQLWLQDFRSYTDLELTFAPGLVAVVGPNGLGKTNLLEAIGYLATLESFRGAPTEVLIRAGADQAIVRGLVERSERELLIEAELRAKGRGRVQLNRQKLSRGRDLVGTVLVSVFAPDDLVLVKGGPSNRRAFVDDLVVGRHRSNDRDRNELDKVLRQRNALLKQCRGRLDGAAAATLDVWDTKFAELGDRWADLRSDALAAIRPAVADAHRDLSAGAADVTVAYEPVWRGSGLAAALEASRETDLRRGVTTIGPHRDEIDIGLAGMPSRTHASQGEQRTLALSLRLAAHRHLAEVHDSSPILLLDDVFSELDPSRSAALLASLPAGQVFVSTAGPLPVDAAPDQHIDLAVRRAV